MAYKILVVKAEPEFVSTFNMLLAGYGKDLDISHAVGRKEAMVELQTGVFDRIITAVKIPRISDGYIFLSHIVKTLSSPRIIVVVDEKSDEVERSIHKLGIKQLFPATNVKGVLQAILEDAGLKSVERPHQAQPFDLGLLTIERIKNSLNWVMGPVGKMIFDDVAKEAGNQNDLNTLVNLIVRDIGDEKKAAMFRDHLKN